MTFAAAAPNLGDAATWAGVLVAALIGIGGIVVGVIGLVQANGARADARRATDAADKANAAADEANRLAKAALVGDDVWWVLVWRGPGLAELENQGHDHPRNARGHVTVDGETVSFEVKRPDAEGVTLSFPDVRIALALERQALDGGVDDMRMGYSTRAVANHNVSWRVTWETALGRTMPTDVQDHSDQAIIPLSANPNGTARRGGFTEIDE